MKKESIIQQLKDKGLRITNQRLSIIDVLVEKGQLHPGAGLIYKEAKKKCKSLSLSSVYATINEFARYGIIKMLQFDGVENRCEGNLKEHINLICMSCGKIIDYQTLISIDQRDVAKKTGFIITTERLEYYGYCQGCRKDKEKSLTDRKPRNKNS
ncbi:MAG: Fur family transcriptional regulator [Syntrophales bacterium]|jgi:Fur family peroxide stress response transcriptional regulator